MSLTDLQAGLMLGFTGGLAVGGLLVFVVHGLAFRRHAGRIDREDERP